VYSSIMLDVGQISYNAGQQLEATYVDACTQANYWRLLEITEDYWRLLQTFYKQQQWLYITSYTLTLDIQEDICTDLACTVARSAGVVPRVITRDEGKDKGALSALGGTIT